MRGHDGRHNNFKNLQIDNYIIHGLVVLDKRYWIFLIKKNGRYYYYYYRWYFNKKKKSLSPMSSFVHFTAHHRPPPSLGRSNFRFSRTKLSPLTNHTLVRCSVIWAPPLNNRMIAKKTRGKTEGERSRSS